MKRLLSHAPHVARLAAGITISDAVAEATIAEWEARTGRSFDEATIAPGDAQAFTDILLQHCHAEACREREGLIRRALRRKPSKARYEARDWTKPIDARIEEEP